MLNAERDSFGIRHVSFGIDVGLVAVRPLVLRQFRHRHDHVPRFHLDEADALRRAADRADAAGAHPQDHALLRDQHQLIVVVHVGDADDLAVAIARLDVDDADAAARLQAVFLELGPLAVAVLRDGQQRGPFADDFHRDDLVALPQADAPDAVCGAPHRADVRLLEPDRHAVARAEEDLFLAVRHLDGDDRIAFFDADGDDAAGARVPERGQVSLLDDALPRRHDDELLPFFCGEFLDGEERRNAFPFLHLHEIRDRLALSTWTDVRDLVDLEPVGAAAVREDHDVRVGGRDEEVAHEILFARAHADAPLAAAALHPVGRDGGSLDVARIRDRDRHVLIGNQVFDPELAALVDDLGPSLV